ncbi:MAG TPA: AMP-binding protein, partial [Fimbriimonadaceae bacterium]|nr:AMP-binding protein [Fimbriimonadaceae bacterium]
MLRMRCSQYGSKTAMLAPAKEGFREIGYGELFETVRAYAGAVDSLGLKKGDRLVIISENCPEWAFADWACQTLGIIVVPIYPTLPPDQAQYIVKDCGAAVVLAGDASQAKKIEGLEGVRTVVLKGDGSVDAMAHDGKHPIDAAEWDKRIDAI